MTGKIDDNPRKRISIEEYDSITDINKNQSKKSKEYLQIGFFICNGIYNNSPIYIGARDSLFYINNHDSKIYLKPLERKYAIRYINE